MNQATNYQTQLPTAFTSWSAFRDWTTEQGMGDLVTATYMIPLANPAAPKGPKLLTPLYYQRELLNAEADAEANGKKGTQKAGRG